jgi:gluconolactonase
LSDESKFTEGPVWNPAGFYLFSDIPDNRIYRIAPGQRKHLFLSESGTNDPFNVDLNPEQAGSNGLCNDHDGGLLICRHGSHSIARYKNQLQTFIDSYGGRPLNSPNDLVLHNNGTLFFSDPPYGLKDGKLNPARFQDKAAVYAWKNGALHVVCDRYQYPNGVALSPGQSELYICSNKPFEKFISVYDAHTFEYKNVFAEENSDGMEVDRHGNLYLCNREGLLVLDASGKRLALFHLAATPANCCWGGPSMRDLLITARQYVFLVKDLLK